MVKGVEGVIKSAFTFMLRAISGAYIANYHVPNNKKHYKSGCIMAKHFEEKYYKPKMQKHLYNDDKVSTD
ncbi:hypothetical protein RJ639_003309 [Escallonia herrerae]|uniref:Uncharacterized protein n=1 Tax=Escallonia herrerae TaxID=1293975 RepID=A0AA88W170_9ASTE|nr:hypothetical protein RJ639_003309 [Escallonia herrerae]